MLESSILTYATNLEDILADKEIKCINQDFHLLSKVLSQVTDNEKYYSFLGNKFDDFDQLISLLFLGHELISLNITKHGFFDIEPFFPAPELTEFSTFNFVSLSEFLNKVYIKRGFLEGFDKFNGSIINFFDLDKNQYFIGFDAYFKSNYSAIETKSIILILKTNLSFKEKFVLASLLEDFRNKKFYSYDQAINQFIPYIDNYNFKLGGVNNGQEI